MVSQRKGLGFKPMSLYVRFVVDEVSLEQFSLRVSSVLICRPKISNSLDQLSMQQAVEAYRVVRC
jgi:hypothetical protein